MLNIQPNTLHNNEVRAILMELRENEAKKNGFCNYACYCLHSKEDVVLWSEVAYDVGLNIAVSKIGDEFHFTASTEDTVGLAIVGFEDMDYYRERQLERKWEDEHFSEQEGCNE